VELFKRSHTTNQQMHAPRKNDTHN
jgi:hypothetical protein